MSDKLIRQMDELALRFNNLSAYTEKLEFWDDENLDFKTLEYCNAQGDVVLSLTPVHIEERVSYNAWLIQHWRKHFLLEEGAKSQQDIDTSRIVRSFDVLKKEFEEKTLKQGKRQVIQSELEGVEEKIKAIAGVRGAVVKELFRLMSSGRETDLFQMPITPSNRLIKSRHLGRLWDITGYKVFLLKVQKSRKIKEIQFIRFKPLTEEQWEKLYKELKGVFIAPNTELELFIKVFKGSADSGKKIVWINRASRSKLINHQTLIQLVVSLLHEISDPGILYKFIIKSFSTQITENLSYNGIKESFKVFNQKRVTPEKEQVKQILKNILNEF